MEFLKKKKIILKTKLERHQDDNQFFTLQLTQHDERGGPLLIPSGVGGVFAGVAASVRHFQVGDTDGRILQALLEKDHPAPEGLVGETLSVRGVIHGDVVSLTVGVLEYPRHLVRTGEGTRMFVNVEPGSGHITVVSSTTGAFQTSCDHEMLCE